jgi:molybdenum cofactor cytidylyltransferase
MSNKKTGIILLAAGGSRRLGSPKQLVSFEGTSLIKHVAVTALIADYPAVVVLGASAEKVGRELTDLAVERVVNKEWKSGISSSIRKGLRALRSGHPELEAVIVMLCDQPQVSPENIERLVEKYTQTGMPVVASYYSGSAGVPALFGYEMFGELLALEGDQGAKGLIRKYEDTLVTTVPNPEAAFDIDTPEDVKQLAKVAA